MIIVTGLLISVVVGTFTYIGLSIYDRIKKSRTTPIPESKQKVYPSLKTSSMASNSGSYVRKSEDGSYHKNSDDIATGIFLGSMMSDDSPSESHSHSSHDFSGGGGSFDGGGGSGSWDSGSSDSGSSFDSGSSSND